MPTREDTAPLAVAQIPTSNHRQGFGMSRENRDHALSGEDAAASGANDPKAEVSDPSRGAGEERVAENREEAGKGEQSAFESLLVEQLSTKMKQLEDENSTLKDQYLRKAADFENFRKRMVKEREETAKFANAGLLLDLIPVIDDFERAIKSSEESHDFTSFHEGIVLIEKQLVEMLERKYALRRFESAGQVFDPERHEAISVAEIPPPADERVVVEDYQKGFTLHDRILRPAKVKVSLEPTVKQTEEKRADSSDRSANSDETREKEGDQ